MSKSHFIQAEKAGRIPPQTVVSLNKKKQKSWTSEDVPGIGEQMGFLKPKQDAQVITFFITKGGVFKSSLCLNFARLCALHNIKTCVIGLDMQGDITSNLGYENGVDENCDLSEALQILEETQGLADFFFERAALKDLVIETNLPTLHLIPETPELVTLDQALTLKNRREYWLKEQVIDVLKPDYDLILLDASPNWNHLITNALCASDLLLSPLECKINNFRNVHMFRTFIEAFKKDLQLNFQQIFVPTRVNLNRKLSREILDWYQSNLSECTQNFVRDLVQGEEATAMRLSLPEYSATLSATTQMNALVKEVWDQLGVDAITQKSTGVDSPSLSEERPCL